MRWKAQGIPIEHDHLMETATEKLWRRARTHLEMGQSVPARAVLETLVERDPADVGARLILGGLAWTGDRVRDATLHALTAARLCREDPSMIIAATNALLQVGEMAAARELLRHPTLLNASPDLQLQLTPLYQKLEEHPEALACFERALAAGMDGTDFRIFRAVELAFNGRLREAEDELRRCVDAGTMCGRAYVELARLRRQASTSNHLPQIERELARTMPGSEDHAGLLFARYKELEDLERFDEAWKALAEANAVMAKRVPVDSVRDERLLDEMLRICTADFLGAPVAGHAGGPQPIFIIGMPRSGTTLLDRLLGGHASIRSAGELRDFGNQMRWIADHAGLLAPDERMLGCLSTLDYAELGRRYLAQTQWRARGKPFFIDKLPANWVVAGLIHKALPGARVLHLVRDPMDVCFSNFRATFGDAYGWSYDLDALARQYRQYRKAMEHWRATMPGRILDVPYAALVEETEAVLRKALAFCGLDWQDACLDPAGNDAPVATLSFTQAREPIHQRSHGLWRRYAGQLEPLRIALGG